MKKILALLAVVGLAVSAGATGSIPANGPQAGVLTFTAATGLIQTNVFPIPYTCQPVVTVYSSSTNNTPFTVSGVTLTNFILTVSTAAATNNSVTWSSFAGFPRYQTGTNALTAGALTTNAFNPPYAFAPILNVEGSSTNLAAVVGIISVNATNFVIQSSTTQTAYWSALGTAFAPGVNNVTQ